jgi:2-hydroxy-3-oxopropionate reductase
MAKLGFVGPGIMGRPMMKNLLKAGYSVVVYTRTASALDACVTDGPERGVSNKDVGARADVIVTMLPDGPQVQEVILGADGILEGARPGAAIVDMRSINLIVSQKIGKACAAKGV